MIVVKKGEVSSWENSLPLRCPYTCIMSVFAALDITTHKFGQVVAQIFGTFSLSPFLDQISGAISFVGCFHTCYSVFLLLDSCMLMKVQ